ncbi:MAG TPA: C25 family cysteine peptidase, partial [Ignavibacteriaceae bacterium]|nr:C25 family cysteine peptidase [Ignavibacteriaceae bacterium]
MKKFYFLSVSFLSIFIFSSLSFGQIPNSSNGIKTNIINTTSSSTTVEFILNRYDQTTININGTPTVFYKIPGSIWLMEKGFPQMPTHRASIIIPDLAGMNYRIISREFRTISTITVTPSKGHFTRDIDPSDVPYIFNEVYNQDVWYPENNFSLDAPYIVRELRGQTIQFNPMQYNPVQGKLRICTRIVVEIYADPSANVVNPFVRQKPFSGVTPEFIDIYKSLFINYGTSNYDYVPLDETGRLLIIYPTTFASNITPFYDWKVEKGMTTLLAEYPTETGTGSAAIKNYIQNLYNSTEGITFIVLVGEASQIPTMNGTYEGAPSDPCYVKLEGTDAYPDAYISRISPSSSDNLDYIIYKFIKYEKYPDTGPEAGWYLKGTGVASNEDGGTGTYDWERMNLIRNMLIENMFFTTVDQIYDPGATAAQVTTVINEGRSIVNYIGHGSGTSWGTTGFGNSNIYNLSNEYKNPFVFDVSCDNGDFTMSECMEEAWVRAGGTANPKGAIGAFGASTLASWVPPCDMQNHSMFLLTTREKQT